ncbi:MAG: GspH/FimT family pseudopilin [Geminicoccaceae bacterium]
MRTRTSRCADGGFTLLELMVVMAIIGLLVFALQGSRLQSGGVLELDGATRAMTDGLRRMRNEAMLQHGDALFVVDVEGRRFSAGNGARMLSLDSGIDLVLTAAREENPNGRSGGIRFFPDGSSTGGRVVLSRDNRESVIEVDWLTGMVSVIDRER